ncbi:unnamed protein product, partial [Didymodactylos carnosus]
FISTRHVCFISAPLRSSSTDIHSNTKWIQNGLTVAGGNGHGNGINQLYNPRGLYVDDDQTIYVADLSNHRIVEWKCGATSGQVVAGGNGSRNGAHQLNSHSDVIVDKERDSLIICDNGNERVVRWPRRNGTSGETFISNISCMDLTMDENGSLYVADNGKDEEEGVKQGIAVASGQGSGNSLSQLSGPGGLVVDQLGAVYVAEYSNHRIMRWPKGATKGSVIAGGKGEGGQSNQLNYPIGLSFDRHGNLYVADQWNNRVQKFNIDSNS